MAEGTHTLVAGDAEKLVRALPVETGAVRSRRIFKGAGASVARLSLDAGQVMKEHVATAPILVQVLAGRAALDIGGERVELPAGALIHLDANVPHSVEALSEAHLLLTRFERAPAVPAPGSAPVVLASSGADSGAVERITARHAELSGALAGLTARLLETATSGDERRLGLARAALLDWCRGPLSQHLDAERTVFGPALRPIDGDLADRLTRERESVDTVLARLAEPGEPTEAATAAVALRVRVAHHLRVVEDSALPVLAATTRLSLASLLADVETLLDGRTGVAADAATCACGVVDDPELPELDVRTVPHAIRHATVFGALDAVTAGQGLILVAPHDPLPLLAQIEQRAPGRFSVSYLERGPEAWRLQLVPSQVG
ncbi:MAG: DUF2249 domain-containing protein [Actinophytocola sp.]|uniref:DUF2249 domain-containing protein n=1 Tax=Actinophytocola sp. TaxID=1872138 RepID=UPI0013291200|nr:DUF2249 domain-containing protein [Actinophytocola sp.]MPZ82690.1 DUF2249 domain-containing protein [Actinophytocola sp.]